MADNPTFHQGEILRNYLSKNKIGVEEFSRMVSKSRQTVYQLFQKNTFEKNDVALFCLLFNLTPSYFGLPEQYFDSPLSERSPQAPSAPIMDCLAFGAKLFNGKATEEDYPKFLEQYFETLISHIEEADTSIFGFHYLNKNKNADWVAQSRYEDHLQRLYAAIESAMARRGVEYRRIFSLPFHEEEPASLAPWEKAYGAFMAKAFEHTFAPTFQHYLRCLRHNEQHSTQHGRFYLYGVPVPPRPFSFWVIDSMVCITEYDRTLRHGISRPDVLFIDKINVQISGNDPVRILRDSYLKDFRDLTTQPYPVTYGIDWQLLNAALAEQKLELDQQLDKSAAALRIIHQRLTEALSDEGQMSDLFVRQIQETRRKQQLETQKQYIAQLIQWLVPVDPADFR